MTIKIGLAQMNSRDNKDENLKQAELLIDRLADAGARLISLPETFNFLGRDDDIAGQAETIDGPSLTRVREKALKLGVFIHAGSIIERRGDRIFNTSVVFGPDGGVVAEYRKLHLFDVVVPGGKVYRESANYTPGDHVSTFVIDGVRFGLSICYDLRFPELYRRLVDLGAQVLLVPAAFAMETGRDHWELLLRARAVENLCWVAAAGQWGPHPPNYLCYGRSLIADPWGVVVAKASDGVMALTAEIDPGTVADRRLNFPALDHRRRDLFGQSEPVSPLENIAGMDITDNDCGNQR